MKRFEKKDFLIMSIIVIFGFILIPVTTFKGFISQYFSFIDRWTSSSVNVITKRIVARLNSNYTASKGDFSLVEFKFVKFLLNIDAKEVYIKGDFNKWNKSNLSKNKDRWEIELPLTKGIYRYIFVVDGKEILDPLNPNIGFYNDKKVSVIEVK
jgi:1,4-alpha-glucan branching enzyme